MMGKKLLQMHLFCTISIGECILLFTICYSVSIDRLYDDLKLDFYRGSNVRRRKLKKHHLKSVVDRIARMSVTDKFSRSSV